MRTDEKLRTPKIKKLTCTTANATCRCPEDKRERNR
jgi:hypothetical protein